MAGVEMGGLPVSAPGAASTRTDRQPIRDLPNAAYGENKEFTEIQSAAPMRAAPRIPTQLFAPSQRPGEPITAGIPMGPGVGPEALGLDGPGYRPATTIAATLEKMARSMPNDQRLRSLLDIANKNGW